jgi:hypothetical protein
MCVVAMYIPRITREDAHYMDFLDEWTLNVDGEKEDCIRESKEWIHEHARRNVG